jgi:hypothetical protein
MGQWVPRILVAAPRCARSLRGAEAIVITAPRSLRVSRIINADRETLFRAWTDPTELAHWWRQAGGRLGVCRGVDRSPRRRPVSAGHDRPGWPDARTTSLQRVRKLLDKYADLPMDFADATLVALAEELDCNSVLTTDRVDFSVYRIKGRKPFRIVPSD